MAIEYPTIADYVGHTPLVRLQRIAVANGNTLLCKLEGNNPAGSVKDRPALSMIERAEARGDIRPGDCLIEATSGNTGIALAMAAAIKGYRLKLIMPANMSSERKAAMSAYGAELIEVTQAEGMERARDLALEMQAAGEGKVLDQFSNLDNPEAHYRTTGPEIWQQTQGTVTHFVSSMGTTGTIMGVSRYLKEQNPGYSDRGAAAAGGLADSGYPPLARGVPAENLRAQPSGSRNRYLPATGGRDHARTGTTRGDFLWRVFRWLGGRCPAVGTGSLQCHHRLHHL